MSIEKMHCEQCGSSLDVKDNESIAFCPSCGAKYILKDNKTTNINNQTTIIEGKTSINEEIQAKLKSADKYVEVKKYDEALQIYYSVSEKYAHIYEAHLGIIKCFNLKRKDSSEIINFYIFHSEYEKDAFKIAKSFKELTVKQKEELDNYFKEYKQGLIAEMDYKIEQLSNSVNEQKKIIGELETQKTIKSENFFSKIEDKVVLGTILSLIVGVLCAFIFNKQSHIIEVIGYVIITISVLIFVVVAMLAPQKQDVEKKLEYARARLVMNNQELEQLNKDKNDLMAEK